MKAFKNFVRLYKFRDKAYQKGYNDAKNEYLKKLQEYQQRYKNVLIAIRDQEQQYWKNQLEERDIEILRLRNIIEDKKRLVADLQGQQIKFEFTVNEVVSSINQAFEYMAKSIQYAKKAQNKIEFHNVEEGKKVLSIFSKMISEK